jgi:hypothetical protein
MAKSKGVRPIYAVRLVLTGAMALLILVAALTQ